MNRKVVILLCLFIIPLNLVGRERKLDIHAIEEIPSHTYYRYVRPQANSIVTDFYATLRKFSKKSEEVVQIKRDFFRLHTEWRDWLYNCDTLDKRCISTLHGHNDRFANFSSHITSLASKAELTSTTHHLLDNQIEYRRTLTKLTNYLVKHLHLLEILSIHLQPEGSPKKEIVEQISQSLKSQSIHINFAIFFFIDRRFRNDFQYVWNYFIFRIEENIVVKKQKDYLSKMVNSLNRNWHFFHAKMVKSNVNPPKNILKSLATIHQRWNSILKMILTKKPRK